MNRQLRQPQGGPIYWVLHLLRDDEATAAGRAMLAVAALAVLTGLAVLAVAWFAAQ